MEPIKCRQCGAPYPVSLDNDSFVCVHCGAPDCIAPDLKERLRKLSKIIKGLAPKAKEIPARLRKIARELLDQGIMAELWIFILGGSLLFVGAISLGATIPRIIETGRHPSAAQIVAQMVHMELFFFLFLYWLFMRWRRRKLFVTFGASPPELPEGAAGCRLCGAPLPEKGFVRRCDYCETDSMVSEKIFAKYGKALSRRVRKIDKITARGLLRNVIIMEHAYSFGGFYFLAFLPITVFGTAIALVFLNNRMIRQRMAQSGVENIPVDPAGNSWLYVMLFLAMGIAFLLFALPGAYRSVQSYRKNLAKKIKDVEKEID